MILWLERDTFEAAGIRLRKSVEIAETRVGHGPIRINEIIDRHVLKEHLAEKLDGLGAHARLKPRVVDGVELLVRGKHAHAMQLQPLSRKVRDEAIDPAVIQHAVHLILQALAVQGSDFGSSEKVVVWH